eukprot:TRINITY_DN12677_c0_g1_i1.p1 TRINITY_DN12677_c0_g1~~TRINITY_DN12677_c0_g1_i1.p1  ORF type:complete len:353 (-),score=44.59 TRINITY_DN12677_c0_g1_i1:78-1136(-)
MMEVSDPFSIHKLLSEKKPIRIKKLKRLIIEDDVRNSTQYELLADALQQSTSLTAVQFSLADYNLVYTLNKILPKHPTIRSVTIESQRASRPVELAPIEKMIQESHWTELKFNIIEDSQVHTVDLMGKICRALMKNNTITTLDLSRFLQHQSGLDNLTQVFKVNNTINSLYIDVVSSADLTGLAAVLEEKKQLVSFGILGCIEEENTTNWQNLSRALRANKSLTHLEMHPEVVEGGTEQIIELIHNNQLKSLEADLYDVDQNIICEALLANTSLTSLDFSGITRCDLLCEVIKVHPALQHLSVALDNAKEQISAFSNALKTNTTITSLNIAKSLETEWLEFRDVFSVNTTIK